MTGEIENLIEAIHRAFAGVMRDDGVTLREARVMDIHSGGSEKQRRKARAQDTDLRWQDVPKNDIQNYAEALCFVDPKGFRYYLPAFMIWALKHTNSHSAAGIAAVNALEYGAERIGGGEPWPHFQLLTIEQKRVIARFMQFMAQGDDDNAINDYWSQFRG